MKYLLPLSMVAVVCFSGCDRSVLTVETQLPVLELVAAYRVDNGPRHHEPSGLVKVGNQLFTVSDKTDDTIFEVIMDGEMARMVPYMKFKPPARGAMDWEGITVDAAGNFCLISETHGRMYVVGDSGWATPDLREAGRKLGLFERNNAQFEGITALGPDHFIGVAEREPRGIVEWQRANGQWQTQAWLKENSPFMGDLPLLRVPDYSGMDTDHGRLFALFRGAHLVVRMEQREGGWHETEAWSYAEFERDPRWAYVTQTYGQAEGLVVDGQEIYIIFDNNRGARQVDASDRTSLLLHLRFPSEDTANPSASGSTSDN